MLLKHHPSLIDMWHNQIYSSAKHGRIFQTFKYDTYSHKQTCFAAAGPLSHQIAHKLHLCQSIDGHY